MVRRTFLRIGGGIMRRSPQGKNERWCPSQKAPTQPTPEAVTLAPRDQCRHHPHQTMETRQEPDPVIEKKRLHSDRGITFRNHVTFRKQYQ